MTLNPYSLYLAAVLGKLRTTRWRCAKPAGRAAEVGSLLITLLGMPEFNLPTLEWIGMFALPLGLFPIPKPSRSAPSDPSPIEREDDGAQPEWGRHRWRWMSALSRFLWKVRETVH